MEVIFTFLGYFLGGAAVFIALCLCLAIVLQGIAALIQIMQGVWAAVLVPVRFGKWLVKSFQVAAADQRRRQSSRADQPAADSAHR